MEGLDREQKILWFIEDMCKENEKKMNEDLKQSSSTLTKLWEDSEW